MADTNDMVHVAQDKLEKLVREDARRVRKAEQTVISENGPQPHCPCVEDGLEAKATETSMAMYDLDLFPYDNVPEDWEEGEDGGERGLAVDNEERHMVDFEPIREVSHTSSACVCMGDDYDFVAAINELLQCVNCAQLVLPGMESYAGELVDVAFNTACFL
jgi:hypothetical protein